MGYVTNNYTVAELCDGFVYSDLHKAGLFGMAGKLLIQPEYQRNYFYSYENKEEAVIRTLLDEDGIQLNTLSFVKRSDGTLEVLDGQQRITSIGRFLTDKFSIIDEEGMRQLFSTLPQDQREKILTSVISVNVGIDLSESSIKKWFFNINREASPLNKQEILNSCYPGPFVSAAKKEFSDPDAAEVGKRGKLVKGAVYRQSHLEAALHWVSSGDIDEYMATHRHSCNITELKDHFNNVLDWALDIFGGVGQSMAGIDWGRLYAEYSDQSYDVDEVVRRAAELFDDDQVERKKNIFEYILGGETEHKLLHVRVFNSATRHSAYTKQTNRAKNKGVSNCPMCAAGSTLNKTKIWKLSEMHADHVTAWSKGGATRASNCQMLCKEHNLAKGNG